MKTNIAIFASGSGTNAEKFFEYFHNHPTINISCLLSNNKNAYALTRAENNRVLSRVFNREEFYQSETILDYLKEKDVSYIVLAGFMWLVPKYLIEAYPDKMFNIHPALLPKYGGKGMYGDHVHNAVISNDEKEFKWIANFVLSDYGSGIVMADAHDQRDFEFAKKYKIPLKFVISSDGKPLDIKNAKEAQIQDGILYDSGKFSGMKNRDALPKIANWLEKNKYGKKTKQMNN